MSTDSFAAYIPEDRRAALAAGIDLPTRSRGSLLFVDIAGFTPLTEALARSLGPRRGAETLTRLLNEVYTALIAAVEGDGGSVIGFSGDAICCWFAAGGEAGGEQTAARHALAAALGAQAAMIGFAHVEVAPDVTATFTVKCALASGTVTRCVVGDPAIQRIDVIGGRAVERMAIVEQSAARGECMADAATLTFAGAEGGAWRTVTSVRVALVLSAPPAPAVESLSSSSAINTPAGAPVSATDWVLPPLREAIAAGRERFLAELRPATALFLRFGGLDLEGDADAPQRLDHYVRWVQGVLQRYGGVLIQLTTGDKGSYLYAAFGAPVAYDDDTLRACAAALELRTPPPALAFISSTQIGLSQGLMRVGAYGSPGRRTYGVLGEEVNVAARLMMQARSGDVIAGASIVATAGAQLKVEPLGLVRLKGRADALAVYRIAALAQQSAANRYASLYQGTLVGRERERSAAQALIDAVGAGQGGVLLLEGAAGIGKSRLLAEIVRSAVGLRIALAAGHSTTQQSPYAALRALLNTLLGLPEEQSAPAERAALVAERVRALDPALEERIPLLREPLDLPLPDTLVTGHLDARLRQLALTTFVLDLVESISYQQPLLIMAEDAHWIDEVSQQLLLAIANVCAQRPMGLVIASRPLAPAESPLLDAIGGLPGLTLLRLAELDAAGTAALAAGQLEGEIEPMAAALIHARAQGNPFFTEELIHALRAAGKLHQDEGRWSLSPETVVALRTAGCLEGDEESPQLKPDAPLVDVDLGVPGSVQGVVLSRLDRLPENARLTLKVASVIGQSFALPLLQQVDALEEIADKLPTFLDEALARDFVRAESAPGQPQGPTYLFKHNITREVAYATLLEEQQRELHESVGVALEASDPDAVDLLAHHFYRSDTARPALRSKAVHYLEEAAERAHQDHANEIALTHFARAATLEPAARFLQGQAQALHALGRREDQRRILDQLARAADAAPFERALLWGDFHEATGDYPGADAALGDALTEARRAADPIRQARALTRLGMVAWRRADYAAAEAHLTEALPLLHEANAPLERADAHYQLGLVYRQTGRYDDARAAFAVDLATARELGRREREARTLTQLGHVESIARRHSRALDFYQQALAIRKAIGDRPGVGAGLVAVAQAFEALGDYSGAEPLLTQALAIHQAVRNRFGQALAWNEIGILYWLVGEYGRAQESLRAGLEISRAIGSDFSEAYLLCNLGQVQRDAGELDAAIATLRHGLEMARTQEDTNLEAIYCSDLALTAWQAGNAEAALDACCTAERLFAELEQPASLTAVYALRARLALDAGDGATAERAVDQALALLDGPSGGEADFPHRDYWMCAAVLETLGNGERALGCRQAARRIVLERAARISSADMRAGYLQSIALHRAIMAWEEPAPS